MHAGDAGEDPLGRVGGDGVFRLAVHAHHLVRIALLGAAQEPLLDRRGAVGDREDQAAVDVEVVQQAADGAAVVVAADGRGQDRLRPQGGEHRGHAARPAQPVLLALDPQDGDGGLRADPLDVAPHVAIQHDVAHQQNAGVEHPVPTAQAKQSTSVCRQDTGTGGTGQGSSEQGAVRAPADRVGE